MSERIRWITHKGKRILFSDYSGLKGEEYIAAIEALKQELVRQPAGSIVLTLNDVTGSVASHPVVKKGQELEEAKNQRGVITFAAMVGLTGMKAALIQFVNRDAHVFASHEEAKDWLVAQADQAAKE